MDLTVGTAVFAGLIGTVVMTAIMYGAAMMGMKMDMPMMLGTMLMPRGTAAWLVGVMVHLMMGAIFFVVYAALFDAFAIESGIVGWAALFGAVHGVIAGMALGMMPMMHPRLETTPAGGGPPSSGGVPAPGIFARNLGPIGPVAIIVLHVVFGAVAGVVYTA
ncbi:MAG: hypothetical protein WEB13_10140 [Dehalococcoidia bacterium]